MRNAGLYVIPLCNPVADTRFRRQALQHFEFGVGPGQMYAFIQAELHSLLPGVEQLLAVQQENNHVSIGAFTLAHAGGHIGRSTMRTRSEWSRVEKGEVST